MARITNYATLQTELKNLLNRTSLTDDVPGFIQDLESDLMDDERAWKYTDRGVVAVSADGLAMPSDLKRIEAWYHDGQVYYGPLEIVNADMIPVLKRTNGTTGVPRYAAVVDGRARFAPAPDGSYSTKMTYWRAITPLSATNTTNFLLLARPDIYKYGAALYAAPFPDDASS